MKPEYRVKITIYDAETEEEVCYEDQPLMDFRDDTLWQARRVLNRFEVVKDDFESTYYPNLNKKYDNEQ